MSFEFPPYISAAERRRRGAAAAAKLAKRSGRPPAPIVIQGRAIATTFWGSAWCKNLEAYSDYANRLPRGRTYARNGSVVDLEITTGRVEALVQGSSLYKIQITFGTLPAPRWNTFKQRSAGRVTNLLDLLQGRLSKEILSDLTERDVGLFPSPSEIRMRCSCPDSASLCKHLAAVLYGVGARLDHKPELFFTLRGVDVGELIAKVTAEVACVGAAPGGTSGSDTLAGEDLSALFGVDLDPGTAPPPAPAAAATRAKPKPIRKKRAPAALAKKPKVAKKARKTGA